MPDETTASTTADATSTATTSVDAPADAASQAQDATPSQRHGIKRDAGATGSPKRPTVKVPADSDDSPSTERRRVGRRPSTATSSGSNVASAPETTKVNTDKLRATADKGKQTIKTIKEKLARINEAVRATETNGVWTGKAADTYRELFLHVLETFNDQLDVLAAYPRDLIAYADEQDQIITETNRLAESVLEEIEAANWPDEL